MEKKTIFKIMKIVLIIAFFICMVFVFAEDSKGPGKKDKDKQEKKAPSGRYTIEQSVSDKAQLHTLAFSGLAFMTGTFGADTFLPPGKVADYFGFQYMRDIDISEAGHNMMFLTNIANNTFRIFTSAQKNLLYKLAEEQEQLYNEFAHKRLVLIKAFRQNLEGDIPSGKKSLSQHAVEQYVADLFEIDGIISFQRAELFGNIIKTLTSSQITELKKLKFNDSSTWPELPRQIAKRGMPKMQNVLVMTYASEFFSWYAGSSDADVYFCPERHGTYFGGFYMKDYPAMGNKDYFIPTELTGNSGEVFLEILNKSQREQITSILPSLKEILSEILVIRRTISGEFRKYLSGNSANKELVLKLSGQYGELDGRLSCLFASQFAAVYKTLTPEQKEKLVTLRNQDVFPKGLYIYSEQIDTPEIPDISFLF